MTVRVVHPQRLAWDGAQTIVRAFGSAQVCDWLDGQFGRLLGPAYQQALTDSRHRLWSSERPDAPQIESGLWRARLDDLLRGSPMLAVMLHELVEETAVQLDRAVDLRVPGPAHRPTTSQVIDLDGFL